MASTTTTKDRAAFRSRIRGLLNEASPGIYTDEDINDWINDGQRDIAIKAKCIEGTAAISLVATTKAYAFTAIDVFTLYWNDRSLHKITPKQAGHIKENGTDPQFFWLWDGNVYIHPTPIAGITPTAVTAYINEEPDDMDNDAATTNLPTAFQDLIILYGTYRGLIKSGKHQQAASIYGIYLRELAYHQTNDSGDFAAPESWDELKIPNRYTQTQGQQAGGK